MSEASLQEEAAKIATRVNKTVEKEGRKLQLRKKELVWLSTAPVGTQHSTEDRHGTLDYKVFLRMLELKILIPSRLKTAIGIMEHELKIFHMFAV